MNNTRIKYLDIAKGIGIICVILGHMSLKWVNIFVYTFHMPLFFFISGYLTKKQPCVPFILKKFRTLVVPYIFTCGWIILLSVPINICTGGVTFAWQQASEWFWASLYGNGSPAPFPFPIKPIGGIWFLLALFLSLVIYNALMTKKFCPLVVIVLVALGYISSQTVYLPWSIQSSCVALVFVHFGYIAKEKAIFRGKNNRWLFLAIVCWLSVMYIDRGEFYLASNHSKNLLLDIIGGLAGSYVIIRLSQEMEKVPHLGDVLMVIGRCSLIILCVHIVELDIFPWRKFWSFWGIANETIMLFLLGIGKIIWYAVGTWFILKFKWLRRVFIVENKANMR